MENLTFWVAVIAVAAAIQSVVIVGIAVALLRFSRQMSASVTELKREALVPLIAHVNTALEKLEDATTLVRNADDQVRTALSRVGTGAARAALIARSGLWPVVGVAQGAVAAYRAFRGGPSGQHPRRDRKTPAVTTAMARDEEARFVYEGGVSHARS